MKLFDREVKKRKKAPVLAANQEWFKDPTHGSMKSLWHNRWVISRTIKEVIQNMKSFFR